MAERYARGALLGEGTYGTVFAATTIPSKESSQSIQVAIKRVKPHEIRPGINFTALREIKCLKRLQHKNIIRLIDSYVSDRVLYLVIEFCVSSLEQVLYLSHLTHYPLKFNDFRACRLFSIEVYFFPPQILNLTAR